MVANLDATHYPAHNTISLTYSSTGELVLDLSDLLDVKVGLCERSLGLYAAQRNKRYQ